MNYKLKVDDLEFLIDDEKEAIVGYQKVLKDFGATEDEVAELTNILQDEIRHLIILKNMLERIKAEKEDHLKKE